MKSSFLISTFVQFHLRLFPAGWYDDSIAGRENASFADFIKNFTGTDLDPFPMRQADGKCLFSPLARRICLLPSSDNNHHE